MVLAGWREDSGYRVYHFTTWAKARAMQHWIDRSGIANRPMPKLGLTAEEIAEAKRQALEWGLKTGAARDVVQAYRRARYSGDAELTSFNAACAVAMSLGRPGEEVENTVRTLLEWRVLPTPTGSAVASRLPKRSRDRRRHSPATRNRRWMMNGRRCRLSSGRRSSRPLGLIRACEVSASSVPALPASSRLPWSSAKPWPPLASRRLRPATSTRRRPPGSPACGDLPPAT